MHGRLLILFDVDLTLIATGASGARALVDVGKRQHGEGFHDRGVEYAGKLDPVIIADLLRVNGLAQEHAPALSEGYMEEMERRLSSPQPGCETLPGVPELLAELRRTSWATPAILTGNFERSGRAKLRACGLDADDFAVRVWAGCAPRTPPRREDLPGVGLARASRLWERAVRGREAVIVGDTVHDVRAACANDCWSLGVLTGHATREELLGAGADAVVDDLSETASVRSLLHGWARSGVV